MARVNTYTQDSVVSGIDKVLGTDVHTGATKNFTFNSVSEWLNSAGAVKIIGQNNYVFQSVGEFPADRLAGNISFLNFGGDGTLFSDVTELIFSDASAGNTSAAPYITTLVGKQVILANLKDLSNFGVYTLQSFIELDTEPGFYQATLVFINGSGALEEAEAYGIAAEGLQAEGGTWGSIAGTITDQTDLVNYVDAEIAAIPTPETPTLESVTNEGNYSGTSIGIGSYSYPPFSPSTLLHIKKGDGGLINQHALLAIEDTSRAGISITTSNTGRGHIFFGNANNSDYAGITYNHLSQTLSWTANGVARWKIDGNGNVLISGNLGVNTAAPSYPVHITGDTYISTGVAVGTSLVYANGVNINNSGQYRIGNAEFISKNANDMNIYQGRMWVQQAGNVGIGTTSPTEKLHVQGTAPKFKLHNTNGFDTFIELYTGSGYSGINLNKDFSINGYNGSPLWTAEGGLIIANQYFYGGYINFRKRYTTTNLAQIGLETGSNTYFNTGNFGIGTTSPATGLHVYSAGGIRSEAPGNASVQIMRNDNAQYSALLRYYSGNSEKWVAGLTDAGDFTGSTGQEFMVGPLKTTPYLLIDPDGNVAIGKETANFLLDVGDGTTNTFITKRNPNGNIYIGSSDNTRFGFAAGQVNLGFATGGDNNNVPLALGTFSNAQPLILGTDNLERVRIDGPTGNVGIGTTSPSWKLHVNSTTRAGIFGWGTPWTSDGVLYTGAYYQTHTPLLVEHHSTSANTSSNFFAKFRNGDDTDVIRLMADGSADFAGNVGIGTTAPTYKLDVVGDINASGDLISGDDIFVGDSLYVAGSVIRFTTESGTKYLQAVGGDLKIQTAVNNDIILRPGGTDNFYFKNTGRLGIGTTSPAVSLDVDGEVHLGPQSTTGFPSIDIASNGRTTIRASAPALSVRDNNNNGGYIDMGGGTLANINSITSASTLSFSSTNVRFGGDTTARVNVIGQASSSQYVLGLRQGSGGSNILLSAQDSTGAQVIGITANGGFYARDSNLIKRYVFDHDFAPSPADGLTTGFEFRTENKNGVLTTFGYIDVTNDDRTLQESSMRFSVGETTPAEIMRLQNNGNVGIGAASPTSTLHVEGAALKQFRLGTKGAPTHPNDTNGREGDFAYDDDFLYIKTANGWGRTQLDFAW